MIYLRNFAKSFPVPQLKKLSIIQPLSLSHKIQYSFFNKKKSSLKEFTDKLNLGLTSLQENNYDASIKYLNQAIEAYTAVRGITPFDQEEQTMLVRAHYELGRLYESQERYMESIDHFLTALDLTKTSASKFNLEQGDIHHSIGRVYMKQAKSSDLKAKSHYAEARGIFKKLAHSNQLGPELLENENMKNLLDEKEEQKQSEKVLEMLENLVETRPETVKGFQDDFSNAYVYLNIGDIYLSFGENSKAVINWNKGLEIIIHKQGKSSQKAIEFYHSISQSLLRAGKAEEARAYIEESLQISLANPNEDQTNIAECYLMSGFAEFRLGQLDKALQSFEKGLVVLNNFPDKYYGEIWICYLTMAEIFLTQSRFAKAKETFDKANLRIMKLLGRSHPEVAGYYLYWADLWKYRANNKDEAIPFYYRALDIYLRSGNIHEQKNT